MAENKTTNKELQSKVMAVVRAVRSEKIRTKEDLRNCGCEICVKALAVLDGAGINKVV